MGSQEENDDSEWEYEYDENETETHYVMLDLTCDRSIQLNSILGRNNTRSQTGNGTTDPSLVGKDERHQDDSPLQFEGLDTATPSVHLNGKTYKLRWADAIGTDLIFKKPEPGTLDDETSNLIACSNLRLICDTNPEETTFTLDRTELLNEYKAMPKPLSLAVSTSSKVEKISQAIFLQKFAALKKEMGETDQIRIGLPPGRTKGFIRGDSPDPETAEAGKKKRGRKPKAQGGLEGGE